MRHTAVLLVVLSAVIQGVAAQDPLAIAAGERVRLTLASGRPAVVGLLVTQDRDSLHVRPQPDAPPIALARAGVTSVDVSLGHHGHAGTGALAGLVVGGVAGAALGGSCGGDFLCPGAGGGALLLGATGTAFGAIVGLFVRSERWEPVYPKQVEVGLVPVPGGAGFGVSLRF